VLIGVAQLGIVVRRLTGEAVRGRAVGPAFGARLFRVVLGGVPGRLALGV
jgi:hypothetical protein